MVLWEFGDFDAVAQKVVRSLRETRIHCPDYPNEPFQVTISAGVAVGDNTEKVLFAADSALDRAKTAGRDRVEVASRD
jgi:PleD family two-component response regulator